MSDKSVVDQIKHYQRDIIKCPDNTKRMIRCIERLMVLPVTIAHLQETGVGRSVNELRKCGGEVGAAANALVCKWKSMVQAEEDSDVESEVEEDEPKVTLQVSSTNLRGSPPYKNESVEKSKNESVDKHRHNKLSDSEEHRKQKSDNILKKNESSHSENSLKKSDQKSSDKRDHKSHRSKSLKSDHGSGSDSKYSSSHRSKTDYDSRSSKKPSSSHRSESECNGDSKTDKLYSKTQFDEIKSTKSSSSESRSKNVKQRNDKDKHHIEDRSQRSEKENRRREESSHRSVSKSSPKKYDVRKIESESSDDDEVYKPRSKKRKKSESEEDQKPEIRIRKTSESEEDQRHNDKYSSKSKHRDSKRQESSEESDARNDSEDDNSQPSSKYSGSQNESDNEEEMSNRSSPNNTSDNEVESDSRSSPRCVKNEDSHSDDRASDSDENDDSPEREIYVPTKIKKEKESLPSSSKTSSDKNKSSHSKNSHTSTHDSSKHSSTHTSISHSKNSKSSSSIKESFESLKIKKEKAESDNSKKLREEKPNNKKIHKPSNSHSDSLNKESNKSEKKTKIKIEKEDDGSIDCVSGASFADALMGLSEPKKKSVKRKSTSTPEKPSKSIEKRPDEKSKSLKPEARISSSSSSSSNTGFKEPNLLSKNIKLEPLDVDLKSTLPEISPHYKPLPHYSPPGSPLGKRSKLLSQEEALSTIMSTKNQRTKVYSGNKSGYLKVPSLFDLCIQVLRDNIEALEYTGGVPYDLLKPVLDRATAVQLFQLEYYNPYLVEDTDGLWKFHCNKDFRGKEPDESESWRELYVRLLEERERKLEALKANITQSMAKNTPVRQTKLAYVDCVVKPPRNIAKKQMKFGTGKAVKHDLVSKAMVGAASSSPAPPAVPVPAPPASSRSSHSNSAFPIPGFLKKKKAPLMQKTLQLIKGNRFKR